MYRFYRSLILFAMITIIVLSACATRPEKATKEPTLYPTMFRVVELKSEENIVVLMDDMGNLYEMEDIETWEVGDGMVAIMNDNGTVDIEDDIIVSVRYIHEEELK